MKEVNALFYTWLIYRVNNNINSSPRINNGWNHPKYHRSDEN